MPRNLKRRPARITLASLVAALAALSIGASFAHAVKPPKTMSALGDSITRAFNTHPVLAPPTCPTFSPAGTFDCPPNSWATGSDPAVNSQFQRITAIDPGRSPVAFNDARSGARMEHLTGVPPLGGQAAAAVSHGADYVTILMGGNDACRSTIAAQTPTATFQAQFQAALDVINAGLPKAYIQVVSIPDINQLHTLYRNDINAQIRWSAFNVCQALLANPTSDAQADLDRRAAFRAQVMAYNDVLEAGCDAYPGNRCKYDDDASFNTTFSASDVSNVTNTGGLNASPFNVIPVFGPGAIPNSTADYFHPSKTGQATIANVTWGSTFSFE